MQQACLRHNATHRLPNGSGSWEGRLTKDWCGGHNWPPFLFLHNGGGRVSRACLLRYSAEERRHARYQAARLPPFDEGPRGRRSLGPGRIFTKAHDDGRSQKPTPTGHPTCQVKAPWDPAGAPESPGARLLEKRRGLLGTFPI